MKEIIFKLIILASVFVAIAGIVNYAYYEFYPGSRPVMYETQGVTLIVYTTINDNYLVLVPTMAEMSKFSNSFSNVVIGGYTAPFKSYEVFTGYTITVVVVPDIVTVAQIATMGTHTLTRVVNDPVKLINECSKNAKRSVYFLFVSIIILFVMPLYSKTLELYEAWKLKREEEEEREENEEEEDENEEEIDEDDLEKIVAEKYLVDKTRVIKRGL